MTPSNALAARALQIIATEPDLSATGIQRRLECDRHELLDVLRILNRAGVIYYMRHDEPQGTLSRRYRLREAI